MKKKKNKKQTSANIRMNQKEPSLVFYFILIALNLIATVLVSRVSASNEVIRIGNGAIPVRTISGVISSVANICLIFLVVFHNKLGFITALIIQGIQLPIMIVNIVAHNNLTAISGIFTNLFTVVAIVLIYQRNKKIDEYQIYELEYVVRQQKFSERLFEQTATALVNAIDAKDTYSHGHSVRVAEYSVKIAKRFGKEDPEELQRIYYAALLHDVGKIGIHEDIINKPGRLTPEEYDIIKKHTIMGNLILSSINEYPYLSIGAHFHHERYDGKGYPIGLKGEDIPEIARIISVADAYDAMSSRRSYRDKLPQQLVREEIIKGAGGQFDPKFARIMQDIIDEDIKYELKERDETEAQKEKKEVECPEYRNEVSEGINVNDHITKIHLKRSHAGKATYDKSGVAMILFDSLDGHFHNEESAIRDLHYFEYAEIWLDGNIQSKEVRKVQAKTIANDNKTAVKRSDTDDIEYDIEAVKYKDHLLIKIIGDTKTIEVTIALPDSSRFVYIGLTGMYCNITDVSVVRDEKKITADYIPRIAEEISYINVPAGDIPNVQIDGHRTDATEGIHLTDKLELKFHSLTLPTAGLIWHCPYIILFHADDGKVYGTNYTEYSLTRLDGENIETGPESETKITTLFGNEFNDWDAWKEKSKAGFECTVVFERKDNVVTMVTENLGVSIVNKTTILDGQTDLYVALTGDECAITNIRINNSQA